MTTVNGDDPDTIDIAFSSPDGTRNRVESVPAVYCPHGVLTYYDCKECDDDNNDE